MMEDNTTLTKSKEETINKCEIFGPKCFTVAIDIFNLPYEAIDAIFLQVHKIVTK